MTSGGATATAPQSGDVEQPMVPVPISRVGDRRNEADRAAGVAAPHRRADIRIREGGRAVLDASTVAARLHQRELPSGAAC